MEVNSRTTLGVDTLPLRCGEGQSKSSRRRTTDVEGGVGGVDGAHKIGQLLHRTLVPLRNCTRNSMVLEDLKDVRGGVTGFLGGVTAWMRGNPECDRAESLLPSSSWDEK